jgi:hypothetical protein
VAGLHDTMLVSAILIAIALVTAVWGRWRGAGTEGSAGI